MIVVFDTNIWLKELALNSTLGAAVRFFLRHRNAQLALPEVVRLEVERNFRKRLDDFVESVRKNHRQLLAVFGKLKEVVLPDDETIQGKVSEIFSGLGIDLLDVSFSLESAKSSFMKTIEKLPPSDQNQQFKDGVLWADCVKLLQRDEVMLVTGDLAFFHNRKSENGLAKNLIAEIEGQPHNLKLFPSISDLLTDIKTEVIVDDDLLINSFMQKHGKMVDDMLEKNGFRLEAPPIVKKALFATEDPIVLYIDFSIDMPCADLSDNQRTNAVLHLEGTGSYNVEDIKYNDVRITGQKLDYLLSDGTSKESKNVILLASNIVIGHRDVVHSVRYQITEEDR